MNEAFDVAIVGAGPAGSGAAAALAGRGWRVLLVERDRLPRHKVCGEFLSPESQATLAALGLGRALAAADPVALVDAELISRRGTRLLTALPGAAWGLSRYAMDAALAAAAAATWCDALARTHRDRSPAAATPGFRSRSVATG